MPADGRTRKNFRLSQAKIDRARKLLGAKTETETIETALDLLVLGKELHEGIKRIAGKGGFVDVDEPVDWRA